jgi:hypothetical protein
MESDQKTHCGERKDKKYAFLVASNDYLFFTTGVYILAELEKEFDVILFLNSSLKENKAIARLKKVYNFTIVYLPCRGKWIAPHISLKRIFTSTLMKYKPALVMQNNFTNVENMYLFFLSKKLLINSLNIVYLNGQQRLRNEKNLKWGQRKQNAIDWSLNQGLPFIWRLVFSIYLLRSSVNKYLNFYFIPFAVTKKFPYSFSFSFNFHKKKRKNLFDVFLVYKKDEETLIGEAIGYKGNIKKVASPQIKHGKECHKILYPNVTQTKMVLICPSFIGFDSFNVEKPLLDKWLHAIKLLELKFNGYRFILKLHPSVVNNKHYQKIIDYISKKNSGLKVYQPWFPIEELIIASEVVVSDVSTTLCWASYYNSKMAISFDFSNCEGSDDMSHVSNVLYFDDLSKFSESQLSALKWNDDEAIIGQDLVIYCLDEIAGKNYA